MQTLALPYSGPTSTNNDDDEDDKAYYCQQCPKWRAYYIIVFQKLGYSASRAETIIDGIIEDCLFGCGEFAYQWFCGVYDDVKEAQRTSKRSRLMLLEKRIKERAERITRQHRRNLAYVRNL